MARDLWETVPARAIELVVAEVYRSELFTENGKPEIAVRLIDVVRNWRGPDKLRCPDDRAPLSLQERSALGLRGRMKIDQGFWDALSSTGREDPVAAAEVVYHRAQVALSAESVLRSSRSTGIGKCTIYAGGERACSHSRGLDRKVVDVSMLENWPPPECDAPWCSCTWTLKVV